MHIKVAGYFKSDKENDNFSRYLHVDGNSRHIVYNVDPTYTPTQHKHLRELLN